jgi:hypothetical protein
MSDYITVNDHLKQKYGEKVYKVSINGGFTCPNRDGTLGTGGCIFCSGMGSGDFAPTSEMSVTDQIEAGINRVKAKNPTKFIVYFQAFTNTYAPVERLEQLYKEAMDHPKIVGLSIATRPDCLPDEVLRLIERLNRIKPVWVELGLQTINEETARYIRRGYSLTVYDEAVKKLRAIGVEVITHVILGLPGETKEDMLKTVEYVAKSGATGIKLQLLHVIRGTDLEKDYNAGLFECMSMEEYVSLIKDCIDILPKDMIIHRMTGDGDKKTLIAPMWSTDKKRVLNALHAALDKV